jgi:hypothetical protein
MAGWRDGEMERWMDGWMIGIMKYGQFRKCDS